MGTLVEFISLDPELVRTVHRVRRFLICEGCSLVGRCSRLSRLFRGGGGGGGLFPLLLNLCPALNIRLLHDFLLFRFDGGVEAGGRFFVCFQQTKLEVLILLFASSIALF